jgi:hypothetical protein
MSSNFWLKIEQFWPFEEISIFSNSGHLEWRAGLSDTILKGTHPCQVWFNLVQGFQRRRFKCESLQRTTTDAKWWQKLTWNLLLWNRGTKLKQIWLGWSLGGPLSILCPTAPFKLAAVTKNRNFFSCPNFWAKDFDVVFIVVFIS